jgi:hypothetical protein
VGPEYGVAITITATGYLRKIVAVCVIYTPIVIIPWLYIPDVTVLAIFAKLNRFFHYKEIVVRIVPWIVDIKILLIDGRIKSCGRSLILGWRHSACNATIIYYRAE